MRCRAPERHSRHGKPGLLVSTTHRVVIKGQACREGAGGAGHEQKKQPEKLAAAERRRRHARLEPLAAPLQLLYAHRDCGAGGRWAGSD